MATTAQHSCPCVTFRRGVVMPDWSVMEVGKAIFRPVLAEELKQ
jgi:hypothetical protein